MVSGRPSAPVHDCCAAEREQAPSPQKRLFQARRDLLNTKLDMLQSYVSLHTHTGQMNRAVLEQVQSLF
ncbi:hypothetical protein [Pseudomonas fluorescens]|uniref:hypothetical protein n=1 Tax=Pseudomonas fluorescens TaxID=294 RepID=UPI000A94ED1D|nr:hypothetical protein [Pseudomonas fluorescens]